ncbi:hypothetical protein CPB84DRAFT_1742863 [Gymnopilus junonius]|uniref:Uncharacterized protein n=1 Tax=Gymnopilus junonius TaxID=109634 RepID=A0A9P5P1A6_GYMJU|nr:hypothetical protein CPB84DRAFT_1742863 [Gymnopilus junonius]
MVQMVMPLVKEMENAVPNQKLKFQTLRALVVEVIERTKKAIVTVMTIIVGVVTVEKAAEAAHLCLHTGAEVEVIVLLPVRVQEVNGVKANVKVINSMITEGRGIPLLQGLQIGSVVVDLRLSSCASFGGMIVGGDILALSITGLVGTMFPDSISAIVDAAA